MREALRILEAMPLQLCPSSAVYGTTLPDLFGGTVPVGGVAGEQRAALSGELGWHKGTAKITSGTSAMANLNTAAKVAFSARRAHPLVLWSFGGACCFSLVETTMSAAWAAE